MYNVWVLNLRAQPPTVQAHIHGESLPVIKKAAAAIADVFIGPEYTLVHEVNAAPLWIEEQ